MQLDLAVVIAIASFIGVLTANVLTSIVASRQAEQQSKDARYRDRLEFLRQVLQSLIEARADAAKASVPASRMEPVEIQLSVAISKARGITLSVDDQVMLDIADRIGTYRHYNEQEQPSVKDRLQAIDQAIERTGFLIAQHLASK